MILIFDTNVFLKKHRHLWELLDYFPSLQSPPEFFIGIDQEQVLISEYINYSEGIDPEDPIRVIVERILDGSGLFVLQRTAKQMRRTLRQRLHQNGCTQPMEAGLFAIAAYFKNGILVHPDEVGNLSIQRKYLEPGVLGKIQKEGVGPYTASVGEILKLLRGAREYTPDNLDDLNDFLYQYRIKGKNSEEREFLEFKCPEGEYLTQELLRKAVTAICGMLNTREGWVFIGIEDGTGDIKPFPPKYKNAIKEASIDQILKDVYAEIDRIIPMPSKVVYTWAILDDLRENCVVVIRVHQGNRDYLYRDQKGLGKNLGTTRYIRRGNQTIADPDWKQL